MTESQKSRLRELIAELSDTDTNPFNDGMPWWTTPETKEGTEVWAANGDRVCICDNPEAAEFIALASMILPEIFEEKK